MKPKALIISGDGINCEVETAMAFEQAGANSKIVKIEDLLKLKDLSEYSLLAFPGGFSFGDEIRSGQIVAELLKLNIKDILDAFIAEKKPVIGICNGFQILVQLGVFGKNIALGTNKSQKFQNEWVELGPVNGEKTFWLNNLSDKTFSMPARHKEGNLQGEFDKAFPIFKYNHDFNGSKEQTAAIINLEGNILGIMPHPEAATHPFLFHNHKYRYEYNQQLFKNAVNYMKERLS